MTSQPRVIGGAPGYQQSQAQPIPNRFPNAQFGPGQGISPQHVSSSPLQHQQYFQQPTGIPQGPHGPVAGTPPNHTMMMSQQPSSMYYNGAPPRPRPPMAPMANSRGQYFIPGVMPPYSMPGPPPSSTTQYFSPGQQHYPYSLPPSQIPRPQASLYPSQFSTYGHPPPQQPQMTQVPQAMPQPTSSGKRERKIIRIVDPNTNQDVTEDIIKGGGSRQESLSTPPSGRSSATPPTTDVAAKFAAQVALAANPTKSASPLATPPMVDAMNQPQYMPQMQQDQQIVGSPSLGTPMGPLNPMNIPPSSSPRPMMPPTYGVQQPMPQLSQSPALVVAPPQMHRGMTPPMQEQMQPAYQLAPQPQTQQFATSPMQTIRPSTPNIPEHVHTFPARSQPVNKSSVSPDTVSQPAPDQIVCPQPLSSTPSSQIAPPPAQANINQNKDVVKPVIDSDKVPNVTPTTEPAAEVQKTDKANELVIVPSEPVEKTATEPESTVETVKVPPPAPEDSEQVPEKEDTAIRLDADNVSQPEKPESNVEQEKPERSELSDDTVDARKSEPPPSEGPKTAEATKPTTPLPSTDSPSVNIIPTTPQQVAVSSEDDKTPVPSAKTVVADTELKLKGDVPKEISESEKFNKPIEKSSSTQPKPSDKPIKKDSTSDAAKQSSKAQTTAEQLKTTEKPVVNGLTATASTDSESSSKGTKSPDDTQSSTKILKEPTSASESKPKMKEASRTRSVSSDKSSSDKSTEKPNGVSADKPKGVNIKYDADQWSPNNPEGKRQYNSDFLLQFQYKKTSLLKPKDLPNIDIVLEQPHRQVAAPMQPMEIRSGDFMPNFMRGGQGSRRGPGRANSRDHRPSGGRSSMSGPSGPKKVISIDKGVDTQLKTTANAWKPAKRDPNMKKQSAEEVEITEVIREVRAILNKLTPNTFKELMQQVLSLKIDTEKKLRGTIDLIFEKAIDEPNFSEAYANMCRQMTAFRVPPEVLPGAEPPAPGQTVEFRKLLLTRCQREFEKNKADQEHLLELKKKVQENTDAELAPLLKEEYEIAESKERRRNLGNIRFIGELFKLRMLTESIMHNCIMSLFKARDDDHLESLCRLLTTIGKDLDHIKGKQRMDQYFDQILKIIQEKRTSSRVRFMLQDVHDLRLSNWVPRATQTQGPKTISQIHQDAKNEEQMLQLKLASAQAPTPTKQGSRHQNRVGSRGHGEDGWTKVSQASKPTRYDPNKMKLKPNQFDSANVTLGPSREFGKWKSGSAGSGITRTGSSGYSPSSSMDKTPEGGRSNTPTNMMNRFSALSQGTQGSDYDYQRRQGGRQSSREGSRTSSRGSMGPPSASSSGGRTPRRDERSTALEAARQLTSDKGYESRQRSSRDSSPSLASPRPSTPQQQPPAAHKYRTDFDEEKMQQKSKNILEEFLSIVDFKEATECIEELNAPPTLMYALVYIGHEFTLEKKKEERVNIGRLMAHLLKRGRLSIEQYVKGLSELLEVAADLELDVPRVWEYIAEQLVPVFEDEQNSDVPLSCLTQLAVTLQEEGKSGIFVAEVVKAIIRKGSLESFITRWQQSNLLWSKILGKDGDAVEKFLESHNLQDLSDSEGPPRQVQSEDSSTSGPANEQYRLEKDITQLLEDNVSNEDIFVWVDDNVKKDDTVKPPFLRALTISICKGSMDMKTKLVNEEKISERSILLKKFIDTNPNRELQTLYALQQLMVVLEQPANVLRKFFDVLYNEDVVSEQTFYKWEKSDDPNEQEGRGVALASANPFLTWMRTAEPESD